MLNFCDVTSTKLDGKILKLLDGRLVEMDLASWLRDNATALTQGGSAAGLKIRILASASGMLINNRVYPGPEWKKAAKNFKDKPILKHHDVEQDAIGRIDSGEFKQLVQGDGFTNDQFNPAGQDNGQPTGLVYVDATITDPDAISKIVTRRILHTSQGSRVQHAYCSECAKDWAMRDYCEHEPGMMSKDSDKKGKKRPMYFRTAGIMPKEISAVNEPGLSMSKIVSTDSMHDASDSKFLELLDKAGMGSPIILADEARSLVLTDAAGNITDVRILKEQSYEILDLSNHQEKNPTDNSAVENSTGGLPVRSKDNKMADVDIKALEDKIAKLEAEKGELVEANKGLRKDKEQLEASGKATADTLKALQEQHDALLDSIQNEMIDRYLVTAAVAEDAKEPTRTNLRALDIASVKFMLAEAERLSKKIQVNAVLNKDIKAEADGTSGGTAPATEQQDTKPRKKPSLRRGM